MELHPVPPRKTGIFSSLITDYADKKAALSSFINNWPDAGGYAAQVAVKSKHPVDRERLSAALLQQYEGIALSPAVTNNIAALRDADTYTVTTGQQIHIFLGPLYVIWKIITVIDLAKKYTEQLPGKRVLPVFWMATEDHDFAEINHVELFGRRLEWQAPEGYTGAVGRLQPDTLLPMIAELDQLFANNSQWPYWSALFTKAYSEYHTLAQATRFLLNEIFGAEGLLILDPDDAALKQSFVPFAETDLFAGINKPAVDAASALLKEQGYSTQVNARDTNLFYLLPDRRERIQRTQDGFATADGAQHFTAAEMRDLLQHSPEVFSPNVILRPLYEEILLPNISYIGGPGEIAYWFQLKQLFEANGVPFPILEQRKSFFILGEKASKQVSQAQVDLEHLFMQEDALERLLIEKSGGTLLSIETHIRQLAALKEEVLLELNKVSGTFNKEIIKSTEQLLKDLKKAENGNLELQKEKNAHFSEKILKIRRSLVSKDFVQERNQFFVQYSTQLDTGKVLEKLYSADLEAEKVYILTIN